MTLSETLKNEISGNILFTKEWTRFINDYRSIIMKSTTLHVIDKANAISNKYMPRRYLRELNLSTQQIEVTLIINELQDPTRFAHKRRLNIPTEAVLNSMYGRFKSLQDRKPYK